MKDLRGIKDLTIHDVKLIGDESTTGRTLQRIPQQRDALLVALMLDRMSNGPGSTGPNRRGEQDVGAGAGARGEAQAALLYALHPGSGRCLPPSQLLSPR